MANLPGDAENLKKACLAQLAYAWAIVDPAGASPWLEGLENGRGRDQAISNFSSRVFDLDPALAVRWVFEIADENLRRQSSEFLARRYLGTQPEKARRWIEENPALPEESKKRLLGE